MTPHSDCRLLLFSVFVCINFVRFEDQENLGFTSI